jgi:hypothetical protein
VEYIVHVDEDRGGKLFATDVTGPNGAALMGAPVVFKRNGLAVSVKMR